MTLEIKREFDWEWRLDRVVTAARARSFSYGRHDCITFAADCLFEMTGIDILQGYRGFWASPDEAAALLKSEGYKTLLNFMKAKLGRPVRPGKARRGDLVYALIDNEPFIGVCLGRRSAFAQNPLVFVDTIQTRWGWRIG